MMLRALLLAALLLSGGLTARAETAAAEEGEDGGAAGPAAVTVELTVSGLAYTAEVTPKAEAPADLRVLRSDGTSMADQGYVLAELGHDACREVGLRFDAGVPPMLAADGSWSVPGGCR